MLSFYSVLYERGRRKKDEDSIALQKVTSIKGELMMALLCDGCGGMEAGETASGYAAEEMSIWFYDEFVPLIAGGGRKKDVQRSVNRKVYDIHEKLKTAGKRRGWRMGSTFTMFLSVGNVFYTFQAGDSAVMMLGRKRSGIITEKHSKGGVLTRCIGSGEYRAPDMKIGKIGKCTAFLIMSDGMYKGLDIREFSKALDPGSINGDETGSKRLKTLSEAAARRGDGDNMSALYLHF